MLGFNADGVVEGGWKLSTASTCTGSIAYLLFPVYRYLSTGGIVPQIPLTIIGPSLAPVIRNAAAVHDTIVRVAAPFMPDNISVKDWVGWLVTLVGISVAAILTVIGWDRAAGHAKRMQDEESLNIIKEVLCEALWNIPILSKDIGIVIRTGGQVNPVVVAAFDSTREGYDQHWTKVYLLPDKRLRRDVVAWFRELKMGRLMLDRFMGVEGPLSTDQLSQRRTASAFWIAHANSGRALFDRLGFDRPENDAMRPD